MQLYDFSSIDDPISAICQKNIKDPIASAVQHKDQLN